MALKILARITVEVMLTDGGGHGVYYITRGSGDNAVDDGEDHGRDNGEYGGICDIEDDGIEYIKDGKDRDEDESESDGVDESEDDNEDNCKDDDIVSADHRG